MIEMPIWFLVFIVIMSVLAGAWLSPKAPKAPDTAVLPEKMIKMISHKDGKVMTWTLRPEDMPNIRRSLRDAGHEVIEHD